MNMQCGEIIKTHSDAHARFSVRVSEKFVAPLKQVAACEGCYPDTILSRIINAHIANALKESGASKRYKKSVKKPNAVARWKGQQLTWLQLGVLRVLIKMRAAEGGDVVVATSTKIAERVSSEHQLTSARNMGLQISILTKKKLINTLFVRKIRGENNPQGADLMAIAIYANLNEVVEI